MNLNRKKNLRNIIKSHYLCNCKDNKLLQKWKLFWQISRHITMRIIYKINVQKPENKDIRNSVGVTWQLDFLTNIDCDNQDGFLYDANWKPIWKPLNKDFIIKSIWRIFKVSKKVDLLSKSMLVFSFINKCIFLTFSNHKFIF